MATWQFDIDLLPRKQLLTLFGTVPPTLNEDLLDSAVTWKEQLLPPDCGSRISKFIPEAQSWSPQIRMWGDADGNRIELLHDDDGYPNAVSVRIDARNPSNQFVGSIVEFANSINAVFLILEDFQVVEPGVASLVMRLHQSHAGRFVENPHEFLEDIRSGRIKIRDNR